MGVLCVPYGGGADMTAPEITYDALRKREAELRAENAQLRAAADETRTAKILAERNLLIGILQLAVEQSGDKDKEPAWFAAACQILNAGFTKTALKGEGDE